MKNKKFWTKTKLNLLVDSILLIAFMIVMNAYATGIAFHEWLGVAILAVITIHILFHWDWVVHFTKKFFTKIKLTPRMNYFVDLGIFISFITIIFSGLVISQSVLPAIGLEGLHSNFWKQLHFTATDLTVFLTALHMALHWKWIKSSLGKYVFQPILKPFKGQHKKQEVVPVKVQSNE